MVRGKVEGLGGFMEFVDRLPSEIDEKLQIICERLAEVGRETAFEHFSEGSSEGNTDWNVTVERIGHLRWEVVASGTQIGFLEFGAGASTQADTFITDVPYEVSDGSYSREHEGMYSKRGFWYFKKQRFTQIAPTHGMYHALVQMQSQARDIIREVFND